MNLKGDFSYLLLVITLDRFTSLEVLISKGDFSYLLLVITLHTFTSLEVLISKGDFSHLLLVMALHAIRYIYYLQVWNSDFQR